MPPTTRWDLQRVLAKTPAVVAAPLADRLPALGPAWRLCSVCWGSGNGGGRRGASVACSIRNPVAMLPYPHEGEGIRVGQCRALARHCLGLLHVLSARRLRRLATAHRHRQLEHRRRRRERKRCRRERLPGVRFFRRKHLGLATPRKRHHHRGSNAANRRLSAEDHDGGQQRQVHPGAPRRRLLALFRHRLLRNERRRGPLYDAQHQAHQRHQHRLRGTSRNYERHANQRRRAPARLAQRRAKRRGWKIFISTFKPISDSALTSMMKPSRRQAASSDARGVGVHSMKSGSRPA